MEPNKDTTRENIQERIRDNLGLPDPVQLSITQLQVLFVDLSKRFTERLQDCQEAELLELQFYMRSITNEIERRHLELKKRGKESWYR